ncbi:MAG: hypothetical protein ACREQB_07175, partial [Candidatus Binataceae bacterium]
LLMAASGGGREPRVAVVGATGAVGGQLLELILSRAFATSELRPFASDAGEATAVDIGDDHHVVHRLESPAQLNRFDIAFLAVPAGIAQEIIAARPGPALIDLSGALRAPSPAAALVAPGLTSREKLTRFKDERVFATPHPAAHAIATCLRALEIDSGFVSAVFLQGASAGGRDRITAAVEQTTDLLSGRLGLEDQEVQRGFNLFVHREELIAREAITSQVSHLLGRAPQIVTTAVAVPVLHGAGLVIHLPAAPKAAGRAEEMLRAAPGLLMVEAGQPLGIADAVGQEAIIVRVDNLLDGVALWCVLDNTRLAALLAMWIAENLPFDAD